MKILFISDIHGSLSALNAFAVFDREQCTQIAILGDLMYHGPRNPLPDEYNRRGRCSDKTGFKDRIIAVRGNCDSEVDQMMVEYPMMETYAQISDSGRNIFTHGHHVFGPDRLPPLQQGSILAFGHTHPGR